MTKIKFGTDGWRAIIAEDFTVKNVARVSEATAVWLKKNFSQPCSVVVGHDCRFAGELFAETVAKVMASHGIKVFLAKDFVSTPMISLGTVRTKLPSLPRGTRRVLSVEIRRGSMASAAPMA